MNNNTNELNKKIEQLKIDYESEWWKPGKIDKFDLKRKMLRVGCRPLQRKYIKCNKQMDTEEEYKQCSNIRPELDECYKSLQMLYYITKREEMLK